MSGSAHIRQWIAVACLTVLVASGCASTREPTTAAPQKQNPPAATAATSASPATAPVDARACAGVEAIIGHITVETARWSPTQHPFDKTVSTRLAVQSRNLAAQAQAATAPGVKRAVRATAASFNEVARAMTTKKRSQLNRAIARSRVAYKQLARVCSLGDSAK